MKNNITLFVLLCGAMLVSLATANTVTESANWDSFSKNLVKGLSSGNQGLRESAMCMVICYSDQLNVSSAVNDVVSVFRSTANPNVKKLALVTLTKMKSSKAIDFLKRHQYYEKDARVKKMIKSALAEYNGLSSSNELANNLTVESN
jgi:hypothetical protein